MGDFTIQFGRLVAYHGSDAEVVVPCGVTTIGRRAFHFSKAKTVILPESVTQIEQEAFLYANISHIEIGQGIRKIGADAFLCNTDVAKTLYPRVPIAVFAKPDQKRAFYQFVHGAGEIPYAPEVYRKNLAFVRKHLLQEIEHQRVCIDVLEEKQELLKEVLSGGKIPEKDKEDLIRRFLASNKPDMMYLLLQYQSEYPDKERKL